MPFGISNIIMSKRSLVFDLSHLSAGPNQVVLCQEFVYLQGSVSGDIVGHPLLWVQTAGPVVTLDDPTILNPSFVNPQTEDVEFRLYVDKGTPFELFDDTVVFRTPATISQFSYGEYTGSTDPLVVTIAPALEEPNGKVANYGIFWIPSTHNEYVGAEIQRWDTNTDEWVTVDTQLKPLDSGTFEMEVGPPSYRFVSLWQNKDGFDDRILKKVEPGIYMSTIDKSPKVIAQGKTISTVQLGSVMTGGATNIFHTGAILKSVETTSTAMLGIESLNGAENIKRVHARLFGHDGSVVTTSTVILGIDVKLNALTVSRSNGISIG